MQVTEYYQYKETKKQCSEMFYCTIILWICQIIIWICLGYFLSSFIFDFVNLYPTLFNSLRSVSWMLYFIYFLFSGETPQANILKAKSMIKRSVS